MEIYIAIILAEAASLGLVVLKTVLASRNEKVWNTIVCGIQILVQLLIYAVVLDNSNDNPIKIACYVIGCGIGCYMGMCLDELLAIGKNLVTVIVDNDEHGKDIILKLRNEGFGITEVNAEMKGKQKIYAMIATKRRRERKIIQKILKEHENAMIVDEVIGSTGGYF